MKTSINKHFSPLLRGLGGVLLLVLAAAAVLTACNVTRTITTQSQYYQRGDTSCVIQTKTIETYDASKKGL